MVIGEIARSGFSDFTVGEKPPALPSAVSVAMLRSPEKGLLSPGRRRGAAACAARTADAAPSPSKSSSAGSTHAGARQRLADCLQRFSEPARPAVAPPPAVAPAPRTSASDAAPSLAQQLSDVSQPAQEALRPRTAPQDEPAADLSARFSQLLAERDAPVSQREEALRGALSRAREACASAVARAELAEAAASHAEAGRAAALGSLAALGAELETQRRESQALQVELAAARELAALLQASLDAAEAHIERMGADMEVTLQRRVEEALTAAAAAAPAAVPPPLPRPAPTPAALRRRRDAEAAKLRGNALFHDGQFEAAAAEYTAGLAAATSAAAAPGGPPQAGTTQLRAVLLSNRAAARQAVGKLLDACSDCGAALAVDPCYARARTRRADVFAALGDYPSAQRDLEALLASSDGADIGSDAELSSVRLKLCDAVARQRGPGGAQADHYAVLGVPAEAEPEQVRAKYRALALRHHPDKACAEGGAALRAAQEVLFKLLSTAHSTLTDPVLRRRFDALRATQAQAAAANAR